MQYNIIQFLLWLNKVFGKFCLFIVICAAAYSGGLGLGMIIASYTN